MINLRAESLSQFLYVEGADTAVYCYSTRFFPLSFVFLRGEWGLSLLRSTAVIYHS